MIRELVIPVMDQTTEQVTLTRWLVREGASIQQGQTICEVESDKATIEIPAASGGIVRRLLIAEGAEIPPLTVIALVGEADEPLPDIDPFYRTNRAAPPKAPPVPSQPAAPTIEKADRILVSPRARRMAEEYGIDLATIQGSGPNGRIIEEDVQAAVERAASARSNPGAIG